MVENVLVDNPIRWQFVVIFFKAEAVVSGRKKKNGSRRFFGGASEWHSRRKAPAPGCELGKKKTLLSSH